MTTIRVYNRTDATNVLADPALVKQRTEALRATDYPYLAPLGEHIANLLEVDHTQGIQAALALAPDLTDKGGYLKSVVGDENADYCEQLLAHIGQTLSPEATARVHKEIALAVSAADSIAP